ncbi:unnamed protein product, partial [Meganyctiphanes norvegica]
MITNKHIYCGNESKANSTNSVRDWPVRFRSLLVFYGKYFTSRILLIFRGHIHTTLGHEIDNQTLQTTTNFTSEMVILLFVDISAQLFLYYHPNLTAAYLPFYLGYLMLLFHIIFDQFLMRSVTKKILEVARNWVFAPLHTFFIHQGRGIWAVRNSMSTNCIWKKIFFFCFSFNKYKILKMIHEKSYLWTLHLLWTEAQIYFFALLYFTKFLKCWKNAFILCKLLSANWFAQEFYQVRKFKTDWENKMDIRTTRGKLKRAVLQFTPESWTAMRWLDPACTYMRFLAVSQLVLFWQVTELNTFFLKHIFQLPPSHPLVFIRIFLHGAMSAPTIRQFYSYVTDPRCKRVGTQCWVYGLCMVIESLICVKHGGILFQETQINNLLLWLLVQALGSVVCVYLCVVYHRWARKRKIDTTAKT